jgi:hypothetical protein
VDLRSSRRASRFHADAPPQVTQEGGDDRVSGTDAERDDDIYHNGTSGFGGNAARGEMADLSRVLINAQVAAHLKWRGQAPSEDRTCPLRQKRRHAFVSTAR